MDAFPFIKAMQSESALRVFLSDNVPLHVHSLTLLLHRLFSDISMMTTNLSDHNDDEKLALIECLRLKSRHVGFLMRQLALHYSRRQSFRSNTHKLMEHWYNFLDSIIDVSLPHNYLKQTKEEGELESKVIDGVINSFGDIKQIEDLLPYKAASSNCLTNEEKGRAFFLMTAFPGLRDLKKPSEILKFLLELSTELDNLPELIFQACEGQPLVLLLIGSLLSFKPRDYDTWNKVKNDLIEIKTNRHMGHIFTYCYDDLPYILKSCFLYLACYPLDYEIPAWSLTEIWIAEGFLTQEKGETIEEAANKYLELLVERSLLCISKRSFLGTIKCCRVRQPIHEFAIKQSNSEKFSAANVDPSELESSLFRLAIHYNNNTQYTEINNNLDLRAFFSFGFHGIVLGKCEFLRVLEMRKSSVPEIGSLSATYLRYLGLKGSEISNLPENIGDMQYLQTLDVRDTNIETLPKSLWKISTLRNVYVNPRPHIIGPPSTAIISNLQILKTVVVPESWKDNFPKCLINLRKLALSNRDNPELKPNPYWKSISILLSHMVNLFSMTIIGDTLPSEFADVRAFPKLEMVKSMKLEGQWNCRKLFIDNVEFPPNLTKLTLTKSGLKEDPMPRLERLKTLKFLSLQDGAYTGNEMVCSTNGFPQLQILELKKLVNLKNLEVKPMAMLQLATLHVALCPNLEKPRNLEHVTIEGIDNPCILENVTIEDIDN